MARPIHKRIRRTLAVFWVGAFSFMLWSMQAQGVDPGIMRSDTWVRVIESDGRIDFRPTADTAGVGLIFFPGALVDPDAYTPLARTISEAGFPVSIIKVPFRMDLMDWQTEAVLERTHSVTDASPSRTWIVGGHSRGGRMAALLVDAHPDVFDGLFLVGTSHPREVDLSGIEMDVTKVFGTNDGLASEEEIRRFAPNLPQDTRFVRIEGANHRQFGFYGWQFGDGTATIDRNEQLRQTAEAGIGQLRRLNQTGR